MDILNKMKVPELKSVLREYKKVHYQPYSKLNREGLIKLIVHHKLHENDLSKHIKVKVKQPPKTSTVTKKADDKYSSELEKALNPLFGENQISGIFVWSMRFVVFGLNAMPLYIMNNEMNEW